MRVVPASPLTRSCFTPQATGHFADATHDRQFLPLGGGPFTSGVSDTRDGWVARPWKASNGRSRATGLVAFNHEPLNDFGTKTYLMPALGNVSDTRVFAVTVDTVRVGLGYKF